MEPEGNKSQYMEPEGAKTVDKNNDQTVSDYMSGKAIFTYRKPIFTAVVIDKKDDQNDTKVQNDSTQSSPVASVDNSHAWPDLSQAKTFDCTEEYRPEQSHDDSDDDDEDSDDKWVLSSIYKYSLIIGFLVGCFIQSSSLGANYILMIVFGRDFDAMAQHHQNIVVFSLSWSFVTSLMGIVILLILRSLIALAGHGLGSSSHSSILARTNGQPTSIFSFPRLSMVAYLEFPFAFGALVGVCGCWAGTDFVLGLESHAYHSLITLAVAYFGKMVFELCSKGSGLCDLSFYSGSQANDENSDNKTTPLLEVPRESPRAKVQRIHKEFKIKGLAIGLLVGFFIQFSSLGASFLIDALANEDNPRHGETAPQMSKQELLMFSLGWSFIFGTMGVAILLPLRYLIGIVCDHILVHSESEGPDAEEEEEMADKWSVSLEFFFAVGCLVGVNIAWLMTDVGLGLNAHVWRSLLTLGAAALWCLLLAYCFGFRYPFPSQGKHNIYPGDKTVTRATQTDENGMLVV